MPSGPSATACSKASGPWGSASTARPDGTFYVWGDLSGLPPALAEGMALFRAALEHQVIAVPGEFFDVNPGKRRRGRASRFRNHARFSFGPPMEVLERALERLGELVRARAA